MASIEGHTSRAYDDALSSLHTRLVEMGGLVLLQVREAAFVLKSFERIGDHARNLARFVEAMVATPR